MGEILQWGCRLYLKRNARALQQTTAAGTGTPREVRGGGAAAGVDCGGRGCRDGGSAATNSWRRTTKTSTPQNDDGGERFERRHRRSRLVPGPTRPPPPLPAEPSPLRTRSPAPPRRPPPRPPASPPRCRGACTP